MGSYRTYSIPRKTTALVPEFAMEDLPLGRIAALVPEFVAKDLPLGRTLMMMIITSLLSLKKNCQTVRGMPMRVKNHRPVFVKAFLACLVR